MKWLKEHRLHIISGIVIVLLLAGAFFLDSSRDSGKVPGEGSVETGAASDAVSMSFAEQQVSGTAVSETVKPDAGAEGAEDQKASSQATPEVGEPAPASPVPSEAVVTPGEQNSTAGADTTTPAASAAPEQAPEQTAAGQPAAENTAGVQPTASPAAGTAETQHAAEDTAETEPRQDSGQTEQTGEEAVPTETAAPSKTAQPAEETPAPETAPEEPAPVSETARCTISISCAAVLDHPDECTEAVWQQLPADGWILQPVTVELQEGDSVFDVLQRVCSEYGIQMEYSSTPGLGTVYIEGIGNLYEFDVGSLSGWMYCVNEEFSNYGCSAYAVSDGDEICWRYTCALGSDIGGGNG